LTAKGRRLLAEAHRATAAVEAKVFGDLPARQQRVFYETSLAVYRRLSRRS
jgi:DNA-binding MarR family transcriptional regulator